MNFHFSLTKGLRFIVPIMLIASLPKLQAQKESYLNSSLGNSELKLMTSLGEYHLQLRSPDCIEVLFLQKGMSKADSSVSIISQVLPVKPVKISDHEFTLGSWTIRIEEKPFGLSFSHPDADPVILKGFTEDAEYKGFKFDIRREKFITGGGMRALPLNMIGKKLKLENRPWYAYGFPADNLNYSIPLFITGSGYAIFFDNTSKGFADIGKKSRKTLHLAGKGGRMSFCLIAGNTIGRITEKFTGLTGRQPLPPLWAFGHLQSRMAYRSQEQTDSIANATLDAGFPLDAMIIDLYWFGDTLFHTMGNLDWHTPNWPEPVTMIRNFREKGIKTVLITEPYIVTGSKNFREADSLGILGKKDDGSTYILEKFYFGPGALLDITDESAREWMWKHYDTLKKQGVAGWWVDLAEPEYHPDGIQYAGGRSENIHNAYGHLWDKMLYDNYQRYFPGERLFNLNRSGFAGSQRFGVLPWTGDVERSWSGLKAQLPIMLNMGMCGVAYVHSDAGGFALGVKDEELYTRWIQYSVFSPVFRPHGSGIPSEPIFFGEKTQDIVRKFIRLRYEMLPYNYSLAYENTLNGTPLARPVFLDESTPSASPTLQSYYWGPSLLVAPVTEPGKKTMKILFPKGKWYNWWTGETYEGQKNHNVALSPETYPLFAKGGSFVPMCPPLFNTDNYTSDTLILHYFPAGTPSQHSFKLYVDDGRDALTPGNGKYERIDLNAEESENLRIQITSQDSGLPDKPAYRILQFVIHGCPGNLYSIEESQNGNGWQQAPDSQNILRFEMEWNHQPLEIRILK